MLFADVNFSTEAIAIVSVLLLSLAGAIGALYKQLLSTKEEQLKEMQSQRNSFKEIAMEATDNLEKAAIARALRAGRPRPAPIAAVIPEHASPTTQKQKDAAELQTMRAKLVAATLQLDLPPREASPLMDPSLDPSAKSDPPTSVAPTPSVEPTPAVKAAEAGVVAAKAALASAVASATSATEAAASAKESAASAAEVKNAVQPGK